MRFKIVWIYYLRPPRTKYFKSNIKQKRLYRERLCAFITLCKDTCVQTVPGGDGGGVGVLWLKQIVFAMVT